MTLNISYSLARSIGFFRHMNPVPPPATLNSPNRLIWFGFRSPGMIEPQTPLASPQKRIKKAPEQGLF